MLATLVRIHGPFKTLFALRDKILDVWENEVSPDVLSRAFITLNCVLRLIIVHKGDNDFRAPHSKIRERFIKAKERKMNVPMVRWAVTEEEYNTGRELVDAWTSNPDNSIELNSIDNAGMPEDDLDNTDIDILIESISNENSNENNNTQSSTTTTTTTATTTTSRRSQGNGIKRKRQSHSSSDESSSDDESSSSDESSVDIDEEEITRMYVKKRRKRDYYWRD